MSTTPESEIDRGRMALARSLPLLIFTLCAVAFISIFAIRNFINLQGAATVFDAMAPVCGGVGVPLAAPVSTNADRHPLVVFRVGSNGAMQVNSDLVPAGWAPESVAAAELVMCVDAVRPALRPLCDNTNSSNQYGEEISVVLRAAQSGQVIASGLVVSDEAAAGECATTLPAPDAAEDVVTGEDVGTWILDQLP